MSYRFNTEEDAETMVEFLHLRTDEDYMVRRHWGGVYWVIIKKNPGQIDGYLWLDAKDRFPIPMP